MRYAVLLALIQLAPQDEVHHLVNLLREGQKLPALTRNAELDKLAQGHADNMAKQDKYGDNGVNGHVLDKKGFQDRALASDYHFLAGAENVGMLKGLKNPENAMAQGWKNSPSHWKNITGDYTETGIGVAVSKSGTRYYVQVFGKPRP